MKPLLLLLFFTISLSAVFSQGKKNSIATPDPNKKIQIVETSCGQCKLGLPGKSCDLAVRINGKAYFVDGTTIDEHGDAHAKEGFCNAIQKAEVQGEIVGDRFKVTFFKLIPAKKKKAALYH
jgi:Family of unknown function (DUF6370)